MHRILAIFRKDARHLWPQIAVFGALLLAAALLDPIYTPYPSAFYWLLPSLALPVACWTLIVSAIHGDRLPGDRQYWLTRPYSRRELLAAKALFIAVFVNLPLLAYHVGVYLAVGIPPWDHLAELLWRQVFFTAFYILPAAAVAAITRNLGQVFAAGLLGFLAIWLAGSAFVFLVRYRVAIWEGFTGPRALAPAAVLAFGLGAILIFQYSRRRTAAARLLTSAVAISAVGVLFLGQQISGHPRSSAGDSPMQLSLDRDPARHSFMISGGYRQIATFDIPVRFRGVPSGIVVEQKRMTVRIALPGRTAEGDGGLHDIRGDRAWLSIFTDRDLVDRFRSQPATLSASLEFKRFDTPQVFPLPHGRPIPIPGIGSCRDTLQPEGWIAFVCLSPSPRRSLMIGASGTRINWVVPQGFVDVSIPTESGFQPLVKFTSQVSYRNWDQIGDAHLWAAQPLAPIRIDFTLPDVRLTDYEVGPIFR